MTSTAGSRPGRPLARYVEDWEPDGLADPLRPTDRAAMAPWWCDRCGAQLLSLEVGPHYRARHPQDRPEVSRR